ncbi:unnamed protein product [Adineta ricciae]|uniref:Major facilitator superfamily (MFS) profile domain-containing protein n=1 Tax=Adineta ricciae TaxID=249248 RepID=A0A814YDN8_ADIRI|nr:unnamed protein product [Adineta ricciae]CAF1227599.1 unnamed protein product [Adineta ricciae]
MLPPIMVYTYSFTAATPNFRCRNPSLQSIDKYNQTFDSLFNEDYRPTSEQCLLHQKSLSLKECQRCFLRSSLINSTLQTCDDYVFDRTYYKKTLIEEWNMVCDRVGYRSWVQMIFFVGYMVGSILFGILADKYGRRPIMSISFLLMTLSSLLCTFGPQKSLGFWPSYVIFVLARFLLACSTRGISVSGFVLGSEIVGPEKRLLTGIVIEYFFAFGQMILLIFAYFIRTWRTLTWAISLFTYPYLFFYYILPESPRWLISKGRFDEGEQVLRKIAKMNGHKFDTNAFEQLKQEQIEIMSQEKHKEGVKSLFQSKIMAMISINLFFQWLVQNLVFYGVSQNTGSWDFDPYTSFGISAFVELLGYIVVHSMLDRVGRKVPYCTFVIMFSFVSFLILPVQYLMEKDGQSEKIIMNIINGTLKFLASSSYAIIYIYANELFPTNVRNTGMGICSMVARIGAIIGTFSNDNLTRLWIHFPVLFYGCASFIAALLALMFPETLHQPLPQSVADVEQMNFMKLESKKSKQIVVHEDENRYERDEMIRF